MTTRPLGDLVIEAQSGFASGEKSEDGVAQIRMNNITIDGSLDMSSIRRIPRNAVSNINKYLLNDGDILFNATNSPSLVGKTARFVDQGEPFTFSNHFVRLTADPNQLDSRYLARWLTLQQQRGVFELLCTQWVNQASVRKEDLLSQQIPLPPLAEQKRIAAILDQADALRVKRRAALARLDRLVQTVFLEMFGDPVTNPMGWDIHPLIEIVDQHRPITYGILKPGPDLPNGIPYIRVVDVQNQRIMIGQLRKTSPEIAHAYRRSTLKPDDLLISIRGHVGRLAIVPPELLGANITQDTARLAIKNSLCNVLFIMAVLESVQMQRLMHEFVRGIAVQGINLGDIKKLPIPVPPLPLQNQFANVVAHYNKLKQNCEYQLCKHEDLFHALQQRAFRGEL